MTDTLMKVHTILKEIVTLAWRPTDPMKNAMKAETLTLFLWSMTLLRRLNLSTSKICLICCMVNVVPQTDTAIFSLSPVLAS